MIARVLRSLWRPDAAVRADGGRPVGFHLMRYFMVTSLVAFTAVALVLYFLLRMEEAFFEQAQREQSVFFAQVQAQLSRQHEESARRNLLAVHEVGHVNLTRLFANVLWDTHFAPFVAQAQQLPVDHCRATAVGKEAAAAGQPNARRACFAALGAKIMSLPGFAALDAKAYATMRNSTAFKIKVFDLRGITVYSSEHNQIGEDKADNMGWKVAVGGRPASELTHRDQFSAFEGVVENRDLISSYVPVRAPGSDRIIGVFEIYSDVTPLLGQVKEASAKIASLTAANQARLDQAARENHQKVHSSSNRFLAIVGGLLTLLYVALLLLVRNGQRIIEAQARAQERSTLREQQWHREKMAALATMAANVSHEVGNPLAKISGVAQDIAEQREKCGYAVCEPNLILAQTRHIAEMTRQIADFAAARRETPELADVNGMVKGVCDFLGFDRRFRETRIEFRPGGQVPARVVIADHLNEVLMNLLQACAEGAPEQQAVRVPILVETELRGGDVLIRIGCGSAAAAVAPADAFSDSRFESARRRVAGMGGRMSLAGSAIEIALPASPPDAAAA